MDVMETPTSSTALSISSYQTFQTTYKKYILRVWKIWYLRLYMILDLWKEIGKPYLGAWGFQMGSCADGLEISQFTYFQQRQNDLNPFHEITYGIERLAMVVQQDNIYDLLGVIIFYGEIQHQTEVEQSKYNF